MSVLGQCVTMLPILFFLACGSHSSGNSQNGQLWWARDFACDSDSDSNSDSGPDPGHLFHSMGICFIPVLIQGHSSDSGSDSGDSRSHQGAFQGALFHSGVLAMLETFGRSFMCCCCKHMSRGL